VGAGEGGRLEQTAFSGASEEGFAKDGQQSDMRNQGCE
jgi:hypothetical protein